MSYRIMVASFPSIRPLAIMERGLPFVLTFFFAGATLLAGTVIEDRPEIGVARSVTPARTEDVLGILGVAGQVSANVAAYLDATSVASDVRFVGARHFRESLGATAPHQTAVLGSLVRAGVDLVAFPPNSGSMKPTPLDLKALLAAARAFSDLGPHALFALEGPNEPNNFPIIYNGALGGGSGSFLPVAEFQKDWYAAIKADPELARVPVYTPTLTGAETDNVGLQFARIPVAAGVSMSDNTVFADVLNIHVYPLFSGTAQSVDPAIGNVLSKQLSANFVRTYRNHYSGYSLPAAQALPKAITEFGLHTKAGAAGLPSPVDAQTQGKAILTALLNAWSDNYALLSIYELYDEDDGFGIFSRPGVPREAATYLHNFAAILNDAGPDAKSFLPVPLKVTVANLPMTGRSQVFETANGNYFVVLWNNVANYGLLARVPISAPITRVRVGFASPGRISFYDPTEAARPSSASHGLKTSVPLADHPVIVQFVPDHANGR